MSHGSGSHGSHTGGSRGLRPGGAERILAERLARGEIDIEEYERRLAVLERTSDVDRI
jgi:putative membrane protein